MNGIHTKVTTEHLKRDAYLYVRQSTVRQVFENTESTDRQYALRGKAIALGWPRDRIVVIDSDLGKSGARSIDREGFQKLVAQVTLGKVGIVLGLEVSRLARNSTDWHRLLEICALSNTLILDEEGIYNPNDFNDRLLLGLKGTMSEAELHVMRARLRGGLLNKARRGEFKTRLPVGYVYDVRKQVCRDPNLRVRESVELFFKIFGLKQSATGTVRYFRDEKLGYPRCLSGGADPEEVHWGTLSTSTALRMLQHPIYAGAYSYGRTHQTKDENGRTHSHKLPREKWEVLIPDAHEGYITFDEYEGNLKQLQCNAQAHGSDRRRGPAREGPALLQGLVVCGVCGKRMTIRYHRRKEVLVPDYVCQREKIEHGSEICQQVPGGLIDQTMDRLLLETVNPLSLEVSLAVEQELNNNRQEVERCHAQRVEQLRYEAQLAQRRYLKVDPDNRLVADELESDWNTKLRALNEASEEHKQQCQVGGDKLKAQQQEAIRVLAQEFPKLWSDPKTPQQERKRMIRLLIEDVTLIKDQELTIQVRFKGGATRTLVLAKPLSAPQLRKTDPEIVQEIDRLLEEGSDKQIAIELNGRELRTGTDEAFSARIIGKIRRAYNLKSRYERLRGKGLKTLREMAELMGVSTGTVKQWRNCELIKSHVYNDRRECLYEAEGEALPKKQQGIKLSERTRTNHILTNETNEA
jgi:DNA invertase Pin-like site-specific DNA recombinase